MGRQDLKDPMLHAAAEGIASDDHLRWMEYADQELARLRQRLGLPNPTGYSCGLPNYDVSGSERAQHGSSFPAPVASAMESSQTAHATAHGGANVR